MSDRDYKMWVWIGLCFAFTLLFGMCCHFNTISMRENRDEINALVRDVEFLQDKLQFKNIVEEEKEEEGG